MGHPQRQKARQAHQNPQNFANDAKLCATWRRGCSGSHVRVNKQRPYEDIFAARARVARVAG